MKTASIIGFGRFGQTLYRLLKDDFIFKIFNRNPEITPSFILEKKDSYSTDISNIYESEFIFFAVPISAFEQTIIDQKKYFKNQTLIDVLSVKVFPKNILIKETAGLSVGVILTHPLFGPDSTNSGFENKKITVENITASTEKYDQITSIFRKNKLDVLVLDAETHDRMASKSQGVTHIIGRLLNEIGIKPTIIDTDGATKLNQIIESTCNDTLDLFYELQRKNAYSREVFEELKKAILKLETDIFSTID